MAGRKTAPLLLFFIALFLLCGCGGNTPPSRALPLEAPAPTAEPSATPDPGIYIGSTRYAPDTVSLRLESADPALAETLARFPALETVRFIGEPVPTEIQDVFLAACPDVHFLWDTLLLDKLVAPHALGVSFAGETLTEEELPALREGLSHLPQLEWVDLSGCGLPEETLIDLCGEFPALDISYDFQLYGVDVNTFDREIDLSKRDLRIDHAEALEAAFPRFRQLEKVVLCKCGLSNEELDALDRKYPDIRIVWQIFIGDYYLRTDATYFISAKYSIKEKLVSRQMQDIRYCHDLIALDLGHMEINNLDFLYDLPQLQYLILAEDPVTDITPIGSLKELKYLEMFWTKAPDMSPLLGCTALEDLNISYTWPKADDAFEVLRQMPWLQRLWYCGSYMSEEQVAELKAIMPDCEMYLALHGEPTGSTWREHPHYFTMRDTFEMYYMKGGTNGVDENGHQIIVQG